MEGLDGEAAANWAGRTAVPADTAQLWYTLDNKDECSTQRSTCFGYIFKVFVKEKEKLGERENG